MTKLPAILVLGAFIIIVSFMGLQHSVNNPANVASTTIPVAENIDPIAFAVPISPAIYNLDLAKSIVATYNASHVYIEDVYDCDEMSYDLWDQAKAKGLDVEIMLGNPRADYEVTGIIHAWVVVDVESNQWIALESTNGKINTSYNYMRGRMFNDPAAAQLWLKYQGSGNSTKVKQNIGREVELTPFEVN